MTIGELLGLSRDITVTALLIIAVYGSFRAWWVPGWLYRQVQQERDEYKRELFGSLGVADRATRVAERTAKEITGRRGEDG